MHISKKQKYAGVGVDALIDPNNEKTCSNNPNKQTNHKINVGAGPVSAQNGITLRTNHKIITKMRRSGANNKSGVNNKKMLLNKTKNHVNI